MSDKQSELGGPPSAPIAARIDRAFLLGADDASQRLGVRRLVKELLEQLDGLKDEQGQTPVLTLEARVGLCAVPEEVPFDTVEGRYPLGTDRAGHRLGLRDLVAQLRERIDARVAREGNAAEPLARRPHRAAIGCVRPCDA